MKTRRDAWDSGPPALPPSLAFNRWAYYKWRSKWRVEWLATVHKVQNWNLNWTLPVTDSHLPYPPQCPRALESTLWATFFCSQQWQKKTHWAPYYATLHKHSCWPRKPSSLDTSPKVPFPNTPPGLLPLSLAHVFIISTLTPQLRDSLFLPLSLDCELPEDRDCIWSICNPRAQCRAPGFVGRINEWMNGSVDAHLFSVVKSFFVLFPTTHCHHKPLSYLSSIKSIEKYEHFHFWKLYCHECYCPPLLLPKLYCP